MSVNRRRWSNDLLDSLIDFQNKTCSELDDTLDNNKEVGCAYLQVDKCTLEKFNTDSENSKSSWVKNLDYNEYNEGSMPTLILSCSKTSERNNASSNILNLTMTEYGNEKESANINQFLSLNEKITKNVTVSSDSETAKFFSCDSSNQNTTQSVKSQSTQYSCEIFHEAETFDDEKIIQKNESLNSLPQVVPSSQNHEFSAQNKDISEKNRFSLNLMAFDKQGEMTQRFFSSPVEFPNLDKEMLGEIDHPDIWDALLELDQALSPFGEQENSSEETQPTSNILNRLSQKFKKTPSRFTEKLISILEDSVISTESPSKHNAANNSGISLHRMTGEFRKLCKFIEDESMPEWAPSMMNITTLCGEKTETPESEQINKNPNYATPKNMIRNIQNTPTRKSTPLALKAFFTPKNKIRSRNQTPIKQFTPSADKSFEYWEKICNMMCDPSSVEKAKRKTPIVQEGPKLSMDEILTICDRQMASLDDSTIEVRTSEPCKKTDSEIKLKVLQAPRSKSVSKMYETSEKKPKSSSKKKEVEMIQDEIIGNDIPQSSHKNESTREQQAINLNDTLNDTVLMSNSNSSSDDSYFLRKRDLETNDQESFKSVFNQLRLDEQGSFQSDYELLRNQKSQEQKSFENEFKLITYSPQERQSKPQVESPYDPDDSDCSLLVELAKRRQRCLDTAKLMMEIDQENPMTNEDHKCLETLYKLGIQDKTFVEVEEDTKFLNTLNKCLEYRNYFSDKSKPIIKALQKFDTPEELKKKATSIIRSQSQVSVKKPLSKLALPRTNSTKSLQRTNLAKSLQRTNSATSLQRTNSVKSLQRTNSAKNLQDKRMTPRLAPSTTAPKVTPRVTRTSSNLRATPKVSTMTTSFITTTPKIMPASTSKVTPQITKRSLQAHSEQSKPGHKLPTKTLQSQPKPLLRRPILGLTPKMTQKLTPPSDLKPFTSKLAEKLTPPSEPKLITLKPTPRSVATLKNTDEMNPSPKPTPRSRYFISPGKSPNVVTLGRKKPASYFSENAIKSPLTPYKVNYDSVKSPIGLYINGVDNNLIQNVHAKTNSWLLTPVSHEKIGKTPKLQIKLASKENQSPAVNCDENIVLPTVRYQSAKNVCLIDKKSNYSPSSLTPNSRTKKLLEPIENTVIIRHEGRVIEPSMDTDYLNAETSIRVQKVAEKTALRRKLV